MAESKKTVQRKIRSVRNTRKITQAMRMIAASKLRRTQAHALSAHPYAHAVAAMLTQMVSRGVGRRHPLLWPRETIKAVGYVVITSDRGLAGPYNHRIVRHAEQVMAAQSAEPALITVGAKGRHYFASRGQTPLRSFVGFHDDARADDARELADAVTALYLEGRIDEIVLVYMTFAGLAHQEPVDVRLLPLALTPPDMEAHGPDFIVVPSEEAILDTLAPRFVATVVQQALREAKAAEHSARMLAMEDASTNADDMLDRLTLAHNRARQAAITREVTEIVGSADASSK